MLIHWLCVDICVLSEQANSLMPIDHFIYKADKRGRYSKRLDGKELDIQGKEKAMGSKSVLIVGAGAEIALGFKSGKDFTYDTFYRKKPALYDALNDFYKARVNLDDKRTPGHYQKYFLFSYNGSLFNKVIKRIQSQNPNYFINRYGIESDLIDDGVRKKFFSDLIEEEYSESDKGNSDLIPSDAHFGLLESYYSSILQPKKHPIQFWKLINFYWSAFFSTLLPITDKEYGADGQYQKNKYQFVLSRLNEIICEIFEKSSIERFIQDGNASYYEKLKGRFDGGVITTNYTPYASYVVDCDWEKIAYLSGSLATFEDPVSLSIKDICRGDSGIKPTEFVFPYLMVQSPVKPIIGQKQIKQLGKAIDMLRAADEIVVLGYSFCLEDAHIASIVGEELRESEKTLLFLKHCEKGSDCTTDSVVRNQLKKSLMLDEETAIRQVKVEFISDAASDAIRSLSKKKIY